jgi:polyisoprenyl-teichoic acid--peptidoglycan teichoic acid transferase
MQRQRCVIGSLARQTDTTELLTAFPKLVKVLKHTVATDIPASRLPSLIQAAGDHPVKVATIGFTPPTYNRGWSNGYPIPDVAKIQRAVHRLTSQAPATTPTTRADPDGLGSAPATTRPPATTGSGGTSSRRGPACSTAG